MNVYIGLSYPNTRKIGAELISWWIERPYSHALVIFEYEDSKPAVFQASHGTVHFQSLENFLKENTIVRKFKIELSEKEHSLAFDDCMNLACQEYSKMELAQIFWTDIVYSCFNKTIGSEDMTGYICSELVGQFCINRLGLEFTKPTYLLKPSDVDDVLTGKYPLS